MRGRSKLVGVGVLLAVVAGLGITLIVKAPPAFLKQAQPAFASFSSPPPSGPYVTRTLPVRFCVNTAIAGCATSLSDGTAPKPNPLPSVSTYEPVSMVCWQDGSNFTGPYTTNRWFWIKSQSGKVGFISASVVPVNRQTKVPACSTNKSIVAVETAVERYGQRTASSADRALFANSEWAPGPVGEWSGDCVKLPYVAWHAAGVPILKNNALANYNYYHGKGLVKGGTPPVGAVVWFNIDRPLGHEAIYVGDGLTASTLGVDGNNKPNVVKPYTSWGSYLGWWLP